MSNPIALLDRPSHGRLLVWCFGLLGLFMAARDFVEARYCGIAEETEVSRVELLR